MISTLNCQVDEFKGVTDSTGVVTIPFKESMGHLVNVVVSAAKGGFWCEVVSACGVWVEVRCMSMYGPLACTNVEIDWMAVGT